MINKLLCFLFIGLLSSFDNVIAQNNFNLGIGAGPTFPLLEFTKEDRAKPFSSRSMLGMNTSIIVQYLFKNKIGLETGLIVTIQRFLVKANSLNIGSKILADSYSMPFLLLYKGDLRSTPFVNINLLLGPIIEFPSYIPIVGVGKYDVNYEKREKIMVNLLGGFRFSFNKKELKNLELGFSYVHKLKPSYELNLANTPLYLKPKSHSFKIQICYFIIRRN